MSQRFDQLNRRAVRRLKRGDKITERGITAECMQNGDIRYSVNVMVDGQRVHRVIGRQSDGTTRSQCEEFIAKVRSDAKADRLNLPKGRKTKLTFATAAALYITLLRESDGYQIAAKERHLRLHLTPEFGQMPLDKISTFTLEKCRKALRAKGLAPGSMNLVLSTYRHMANKLFEWKKIDTPLPMIQLTGPDNRREYVLGGEEKELLLEAALRDSNARIWLFIMMGLNTSLRHSEILSARFDRFNASRRRLRVQVKGGDWREQPLTRTIADLLEREREMSQDQEGWVFPSAGTATGHVESIQGAYRRVVRGAGLDPKMVTPHTMRHTAITEMAEAGAEARTIQAFSGHKSQAMVWRYTHARDQRIDEALDRFDSGRTKVEQLRDRKRPRS